MAKQSKISKAKAPKKSENNKAWESLKRPITAVDFYPGNVSLKDFEDLGAIDTSTNPWANK
jgi:hypothetical protein